MAQVLPFVTSLEFLILVTCTTSGLFTNNHNNDPDMKNITCSSIFTGNGYIYRVSSNIQSALLQDKDCEPRWYKGPKLLSDGQVRVNQTRHPLVVDENLNNITLKTCIELQLCVICDGLNQKFVLHYKVINDTNLSPTSPQQKSRNHLISIVIPIITFFIVIGLLLYMRQTSVLYSL